MSEFKGADTDFIGKRIQGMLKADSERLDEMEACEHIAGDISVRKPVAVSAKPTSRKAKDKRGHLRSLRMANPYAPSVKQKILNHMAGFGWFSKPYLETLAPEWGVLADNVDRRCRELVADGKLEKRKFGKTIEYKRI